MSGEKKPAGYLLFWGIEIFAKLFSVGKEFYQDCFLFFW